jgi:hypothetical protein
MNQEYPVKGRGNVMAEASNGRALSLETGNNQETHAPPGEYSTFELRMFEPQRIRVFRVAGVTRLTLENDRSWIKVSIASAFPLSDPDHYIGFLDGGGKDVGMLYDPALLDPASRRLVEEELERRYFVPVVERVQSVKEEFGTVYWKVETDKGEKEIVVRNLRDNLQELSSTRLIITDVDGNRFEFPDIAKLDGKSQSIIMRSL